MDKTTLVKEIIELQRKVDRYRRETTLDAWMSLPPITIAQLKSLFFISNQGSTNSGQAGSGARGYAGQCNGYRGPAGRARLSDPHRKCPGPPYAVTSNHGKRGRTCGES